MLTYPFVPELPAHGLSWSRLTQREECPMAFRTDMSCMWGRPLYVLSLSSGLLLAKVFNFI